MNRILYVLAAMIFAAAPAWALTVTSINPTTGDVVGNFPVTIAGTGFATGNPAPTVDFSGTAATGVSVVDSMTITATAPAHAAGAVTVTVKQTGQTGTVAFTYTTTSPGPGPGPGPAPGCTTTAASGFRFLTTTLPDGSTNTFYADTVYTANAQGPVTFMQNGLPPGMSLDAGTGFVSGRPTVVNGSGVPVTVTATDGVSTICFTTNLRVTATGGGGNGGVTFTTTALPSGVAGQAYSVAITVSGNAGAVIFGAAGLPPGLNMDGLSGVMRVRPRPPVRFSRR